MLVMPKYKHTCVNCRTYFHLWSVFILNPGIFSLKAIVGSLFLPYSAPWSHVQLHQIILYAPLRGQQVRWGKHWGFCRNDLSFSNFIDEFHHEGFLPPVHTVYRNSSYCHDDNKVYGNIYFAHISIPILGGTYRRRAPIISQLSVNWPLKNKFRLIYEVSLCEFRTNSSMDWTP